MKAYTILALASSANSFQLFSSRKTKVVTQSSNNNIQSFIKQRFHSKDAFHTLDSSFPNYQNNYRKLPAVLSATAIVPKARTHGVGDGNLLMGVVAVVFLLKIFRYLKTSKSNRKGGEFLPNWGYLCNSKEEELKYLKAYTCKNCGMTIFPARGRDSKFVPKKSMKCFECGTEGIENFYDRREKIMEEQGDVDYDKEFSFLGQQQEVLELAKKKQLAKEAKMREEQEMMALMGEAEFDEEEVENGDVTSDAAADTTEKEHEDEIVAAELKEEDSTNLSDEEENAEEDAEEDSSSEEGDVVVESNEEDDAAANSDSEKELN